MEKLLVRAFAVLLVAGGMLAPSRVLAQEAAGPATFAGSITLWGAIIIGFAASALALYYGFQMKGSLLGRVTLFFGLGMLFIVVGFLSVVVAWASPPTQKLVHDIVFIVGYIFLFVGVVRIKKLSA